MSRSFSLHSLVRKDSISVSLDYEILESRLALSATWLLGDRVASYADEAPFLQTAAADQLITSDVPPTASLIEAGSLIGIDSFRSDLRFSGIDGTGFSVVIIDTGIDLNHPDWGPDLNADGISDRIVFQFDFSGGNDNSAQDTAGHGTNVSGIALSSNPVRPGIAPGASIIHLKVFPDGPSTLASDSDIREALQWVVGNVTTFNIASVNMSLGSGNFTSAVANGFYSAELAALTAMNVIVVSASGNDFFSNGSATGVQYPSADVNSLSVGAVYDSDVGFSAYVSGAIANTTGADRLAPFSQRHSQLTTIFAPGANSTSTGLGGGTSTMDGTSQAAPVISGIAALSQQLAVRDLGRRLTFGEFRNLLRETGVTIVDGDDEDDNVANTGASFKRVDVMSLANAIRELIPIAPDDFESNNTLASATLLGSQAQTILNGLTIHNATDVDYFKVTAHFTGRLHVKANFFHGDGDINLRIRDSTGDVIFVPPVSSDDEWIDIPVVSQQTYFVEVFGNAGATNYYALEVENFNAPSPAGVFLSNDSNTGDIGDLITADRTPLMYIQTDVTSFVDADANGFIEPFREVRMLTAAEAAAGVTAGIGVEVTLLHSTTGVSVIRYADPLFFSNVYQLQISGLDSLAPGTYLVSSRLVVFDGRIATNGASSPAVGRSTSSPPLWLTIIADQIGPQISGIEVTGNSGFNLFETKPTAGPTPLIAGLTIRIIDQPARFVGFTDPAIDPSVSIVPAHFKLVGDRVGAVNILSVNVVNSTVVLGQPALASIQLTFATPLQDDRYTLTILDSIVDPSGNRLDGESTGVAAGSAPFPSGDGNPGGNFKTRFTVDSRPEVGAYVAQSIRIDANGNFVWDPTAPQGGGDSANVDLTFAMKRANASGGAAAGGFGMHDQAFAGKFHLPQTVLQAGDAVFVVDISGSAINPFGGDSVGDLNGDGVVDTILDAEIAAFMLLNQQLIVQGKGNAARVGIVAFDDVASILDMDPLTPGVQTTTTPLADADADGVLDVEQALQTLVTGGSTNYAAALTQASAIVSQIGKNNVNVVFLSDGVPDVSGDHADEVAALKAQGAKLRAFGVGPAAPVSQLKIIDSVAQAFASTNELLDVFSGKIARRFDQLAIFGNAQDLGNQFRWLVDFDSDGVIKPGTDVFTIQPLNVPNFNVAGAIPVAGNFDANAANGDEIGLYYQGKWAFDLNRDFIINPNEVIVTGSLLGYPVVGDFDGDLRDDLAVFNNNTWYFDLAKDGLGTSNSGPYGPDANGDRDATLAWGFPGVLDRPVAADLDQDGIDDIGLWIPQTNASTKWYFLVSNDFASAGVPATHVPGTIARINHPFTPKPFGFDVYAEFGGQNDLPLVGNFDPPVAQGGASPLPSVEPASLAGDFNRDSQVDGADFLKWQRDFGKKVDPGTGADASQNLVVDQADLAVWSTNYASSSATTDVALASVASILEFAPIPQSVEVDEVIEPRQSLLKSAVSMLPLDEYRYSPNRSNLLQTHQRSIGSLLASSRVELSRTNKAIHAQAIAESYYGAVSLLEDAHLQRLAMQQELPSADDESIDWSSLDLLETCYSDLNETRVSKSS